MTYPVLEFNEYADKFTAWLKSASPSSNYVYYEGFHLQENSIATFIAREAWAAHINGLVHLVQKRRTKNHGGIFAYTAQRTKKAYCEIPSQPVDNGKKKYVKAIY